MLRIIRQVFCFHVWEYESDMFNQKECRKCGKIKCLQPCRLTGFSFFGVFMNRKQKKAKRLIARAHTKKQAQIYMTPKEKQDIYEWNTAHNELHEESMEGFEEPQFIKGFKVGIWLAFCAAIIWIFWHFLG